MLRISRLLPILAMTLTVLNTCAAEPARESSIPDWKATIQTKLMRRVSFELVDTPLDEAISFLISKIKMNIVIGSPDPHNETVSVKANDITIAEALEKVASLTGREVQFLDEAVFIAQKRDPEIPVPKTAFSITEWERSVRTAIGGQRITFEFVDLPVRDACTFFSAHFGINIIVEPSGSQFPVTIRAADMSAEAALRWTARLAGLEIHFCDEAVFLCPPGVFKVKEIFEPTHSQIVSLSQAIANLRADDFNIRESASKTIEDLGLAADQYLRDALKTEADPEAAYRISRALSREQPNLFYESPALSSFLNRQNKTVSVKILNQSPRQAAEYLTGNLRIPVTAPDNDTKVYLTLQNVSAASALRWTARFSGCRYAFESNELRMIPVPTVTP